MKKTLFFALCLCFALNASSGVDVEILYSGNLKPVNADTKSALYLSGGTAYEETFKPFLEDADQGDIVVLKTSGYYKHWYNDHLPDYGTPNSVTTIIFYNENAANDKKIYDQIVNADGVFIAGGNQAKHMKYWKNTLVEDAIHEVYKRKKPLGGTSAGLAILGEYFFSAINGSISSYSALKNPKHSRIKLESGFIKLNPLENTITDSHFTARNRLGRLLVFMSRLLLDTTEKTIHGIGVDEETVLIIREKGQEVRGIGEVHKMSVEQTDISLTKSGLDLRPIKLVSEDGAGIQRERTVEIKSGALTISP